MEILFEIKRFQCEFAFESRVSNGFNLMGIPIQTRECACEWHSQRRPYN